VNTPLSGRFFFLPIIQPHKEKMVGQQGGFLPHCGDVLP